MTIGRYQLLVALLLISFTARPVASLSMYDLLSSKSGLEDGVAQESPSAVLPRTSDGAVNAVDMARVIERRFTAIDFENFGRMVGTLEEDKNYNQLVNGHGTGLRPPTPEEYADIAENAYLVETILPSNVAQTPSAVDHTVEPWFPPIGNQDGEGSCVAWAVGYYMKTFQEAKEHGWNLSEAVWEGGYHGHPSVQYQDQIFSPDFIYHLINFGQDGGSSFNMAINLVCSVGACTWAKMPYNSSDSISWPSEEAWRQAPLYRGNSTGYEYMSLDTDEDLVSLKNWLASGNLAVIAVDGYQYSDLTSDDVWTLDNYVAPNENHANTIVGYDDNFTYTEEGQLRYGAFKVANSWGVGGWENVDDGCYWISYKAMKQRVGYCMFYRDMIGYQPELVASFRIDHDKRSECSITVGMGNTTYPLRTKRFSDYINGGSRPFCPNDIFFDVTEFLEPVSTMYTQSFFLKVYDGGSSTTGTIDRFAIEDTESLDTPLYTVNNQNVYATVTFLVSYLRVFPQSVDLGSGNVIGQSFTVAAVVENEKNLYSLDVKFDWNSTYLECIDHTVAIPVENHPYPVLPSPYAGTLHSPTIVTRNEVNNSLGVLWVSYNSTSPAAAFTGNGTVFTVTLRVKDQPTVDVDVLLCFEQAVFLSSSGRSVSHVVQEGSVMVPKLPPDITPPNILILSPENRTYSVRDFSLTFTVNEETSSMKYSLDDHPNMTVAGNTTFTDLLDGLHYVIVYANDTAGNMGASDIVYFGVDTVPPSIADVSQSPAPDKVSAVDEVEVNVTVTDSFSGVGQVTLNYTNGNGTWFAIGMEYIKTSTWTGTIPSFSCGTYVTYTVMAEDNAGNMVTTEQMGYEHQYNVTPEFPSLLFLPFLIVLTLASVALHRKRLPRKQSLFFH